MYNNYITYIIVTQIPNPTVIEVVALTWYRTNKAKLYTY